MRGNSQIPTSNSQRQKPIGSLGFGSWEFPLFRAHLTTAPRPGEILTALPADARAALQALADAEGQLPEWEFLSRFGPLRPYKPWRRDIPDPTTDPSPSPAETLFYQGLVFQIRKPPAIVLPAELAFHIPPTPRAPEPILPLPVPAPLPDIRLRTVTLLETRDRELLTRLCERRAIRNRLAETLAPRYALISRKTKTRDLIRHLERAGCIVAMDPTPPPALALPPERKSENERASKDAPPPAILHPQDIARLLVAAHLSAMLFDPPPPTFKDTLPTSELIAALQAPLTPEARAQAERAAQDLLDHRLPILEDIPDEPQPIRFPTEQTLPALQTAIDTQCPTNPKRINESRIVTTACHCEERGLRC